MGQHRSRRTVFVVVGLLAVGAVALLMRGHIASLFGPREVSAEGVQTAMAASKAVADGEREQAAAAYRNAARAFRDSEEAALAPVFDDAAALLDTMRRVRPDEPLGLLERFGATPLYVRRAEGAVGAFYAHPEGHVYVTVSALEGERASAPRITETPAGFLVSWAHPVEGGLYTLFALMKTRQAAQEGPVAWYGRVDELPPPRDLLGLVPRTRAPQLEVSLTGLPRPTRSLRAPLPAPLPSEPGTGSGGSEAPVNGGKEAPPPRRLAWKTPEGWVAMDRSQLHEAAFAVPGTGVECTATFLPGDGGGLAANVNRWLAQLKQAPRSEERIAALPRMQVLGQPSVLLEKNGMRVVRLHGRNQTVLSGLLGLYCRLPRRVLLVKLTGPAKAVASQRRNFVRFCESLRFEEPADAASDSGPKAKHITVDHILLGVRGPKFPRGRHTAAEARKLAGELVRKLKEGADWAALKREHSEDPPPGGPYGMADRGVTPNPGEHPRDAMVPAFGDVGFGLGVGEIGIADYDPRKSPFGVHIIKRVK